MIGIMLVRPGLYALCVEAGEVRLNGTNLTIKPQVSGQVDLCGMQAALADMILLGAGIAPAGLVLGSTA
jgi:hypothetical protein